MRHVVLTIGHSNHSWETFLALLTQRGVTALADVRSHPFSQHYPHFSRTELEPALKAAGLAYVFLGKELGARSDMPSCLVDGRADYERMAETPVFKAGLVRIAEGSAKHRICLMCAEKEPLDCHRTVLVSRHLRALGLDVGHVLADGSVESHADVERRLFKLAGVPEHDLFRSREECLTEAYRIRGEKIAWRPGTPEEDAE